MLPTVATNPVAAVEHASAAEPLILDLLSSAAAPCVTWPPLATGACVSAEELGSRHPGARVEVSRRDRLEPTPDPCPHVIRAAHSMVARLDPHSEYCMLHALTGRCRAPAARHRSTGEARIDMLEPSEHAQTHHL